MLAHGGAPFVARIGRRAVFELQEMLHDDARVVEHRAAFGVGQAFHLLDQMVEIERVEAPGTQERRLLLGPDIEVACVQLGSACQLGRHGSSAAFAWRTLSRVRPKTQVISAGRPRRRARRAPAATRAWRRCPAAIASSDRPRSAASTATYQSTSPSSSLSASICVRVERAAVVTQRLLDLARDLARLAREPERRIDDLVPLVVDRGPPGGLLVGVELHRANLVVGWAWQARRAQLRVCQRFAKPLISGLQRAAAAP